VSPAAGDSIFVRPGAPHPVVAVIAATNAKTPNVNRFIRPLFF
jgi:hypothetical protein